MNGSVYLLVISVLGTALIALLIWIIQTSRTDINRQRELWHERFNHLQVVINKLISDLAELKGIVITNITRAKEQREEDAERERELR